MNTSLPVIFIGGYKMWILLPKVERRRTFGIPLHKYCECKVPFSLLYFIFVLATSLSFSSLSVLSYVFLLFSFFLIKGLWGSHFFSISFPLTTFWSHIFNNLPFYPFQMKCILHSFLLNYFFDTLLSINILLRSLFQGMLLYSFPLYYDYNIKRLMISSVFAEIYGKYCRARDVNVYQSSLSEEGIVSLTLTLLQTLTSTDRRKKLHAASLKVILRGYSSKFLLLYHMLK